MPFIYCILQSWRFLDEKMIFIFIPKLTSTQLFFSSLPLWPRVVSLVSSSDMKCNIVNWNSNLLWSSMCTDNNTCFHNSRWQENCLKLKIILNFYNTTEYWCSNSSIKVKGGNETVGFVFLDERNPRLTRVNPVASFSFSPHVILSRQVCRCNF